MLTYSGGVAKIAPSIELPAFSIFPVRYCPKITALAAARVLSGSTQQHWVGAAAHPSGVLSQKRAGTGMLPLSLYGCFNPLTGQAYRDRDKPFSFI